MENRVSASGTAARPGPPHLAGLTEPAGRPGNVSEPYWAGLLEAGWAARLRAEDGRTRFRLHYYGQRCEGLITGDELPALVYAVTASGRRILLFDGAAHGYDAMFCDTWDEDRLRTRRADQVYVDADGEDTFEVVIWAGYGIDWEDERDSFVDADDPGRVTLADGRRIPFDTARRAAFDALSITATNARRRATDVVSEELA
ncbi:hypothetical protein HTV45_07815 [Streptomyces sp. CHD11]|uniref:hypothetical protein n=1 Tax=Streptomyces sp. CHD11 TaxID=2741325 RepID=UPI001BFC8AB3|nr:hypothetical protein [Streptomyces sp. CHD11]MBT3150794.1 hypothetical protein [Streptomyces sp. CHD11]